MEGDHLLDLLRWYPADWRARYGDELLVYMEDQYGDRRPPMRDRLSLVAGGLREHLRQSGLRGDSAPPAERVRAGALAVLAAWAAFVVAGSSFAKLSEHFDNALPGGIHSPGAPGGAHRLADLAYVLVQDTAAVAGFVVLVGVVLAVAPLVRFLRAGGWPALRSHVVRALAAGGLAAGSAVPLVLWAHHLTSAQRNGAVPLYVAAFLAWAVLVAIGVGLWTTLGIVAGRRLGMSRRLLVTEAALAVVLTGAMVVILGATVTWWAAMAANAPAFFGSPGPAPLDPELAVTVSVMVLAGAMAVAGSVRIARGWRVLARA